MPEVLEHVIVICMQELPTKQIFPKKNIEIFLSGEGNAFPMGLLLQLHRGQAIGDQGQGARQPSGHRLQTLNEGAHTSCGLCS